ncbi:DnaJ C-terminal domain-containing protein [Mycoplasma leonicaptivi]|uniref:DnaJ C-terminal domain-containing protein n=1 Tax=Mycoplasma leonicaptivi TaxID=36742 RepID=UPI000482D31D|nr:DnaJ C-terminal domain-containing protein [Mycoplasma leonicaptivi]
MKKRDYYEVLGVAKNASDQEIKTAYRKLAKQYHPDKLKDGSSDAKMQELNEAYEILSDSQKRQTYDQFGHAAANGQGGASGFGGFQGFNGFGGFEDIFENIFSGFGGRSRKSNTGPTKGSDQEAYINITFMQSILGDNLKRKITKYENCLHCGGNGSKNGKSFQSCSTCGGSGHVTKIVQGFFGQQQQVMTCSACSGLGKKIIEKCDNCKGKGNQKVEKDVNIPIQEGTKEGQRLKLSGFGQPGQNGGSSGDLYISINIEPHKFFQRDDENIYLELPVSFLDIMLEKTITVPTPYGDTKIKLSDKYFDKNVIVIPGKGVKTRYGYGDLKLKLKIIKPDLSRFDLKQMNKVLESLNDSSNETFVKKVNKTI